MKITVRQDEVIIDGYVNAVDRFSRPLFESGIGQFIEKILPNVFAKAIKRAKNIDVYLNHDESRLLASTKEGTAVLKEDNVGLRATVRIKDPEVIADARNGNLRGWSFGFSNPVDVRTPTSTGLIERIISALTLHEVSIINAKALPAYIGTSIEARSIENKTVEIRGLDQDTEMDTTDETADDGNQNNQDTKLDDDKRTADAEAESQLKAELETERLKREADIREVSI